MPEPNFVNLTVNELVQIGRSGAKALAEIAAKRGVTAEAVKRSVWHAARLGGGELGSYAHAALNRLRMKVASDAAAGAASAGSGAANAGIAWGSVALHGLVLGAIVVGVFGAYYYATTGSAVPPGWRKPKGFLKVEEKGDHSNGQLDREFRSPLYVIHITGVRTQSGYQERDDYILYHEVPNSDGVLLIPDGSGGTYTHYGYKHSGSHTTPRDVCRATSELKTKSWSSNKIWWKDTRGCVSFDCTNMTGRR